ncbi:hypothetical protein FJ414_17570 [Mesorhizobium sp. B3-1-6]|uniref:DUF7303 family protein n=1 Tax=Mesorhizobium sp. B3-1-6 TaxID=2589895 RepID=UPI00112BC771|nr:hypothetical protein [Mesorhizobium sp. B3-1-6]TPI35859.1 hypothetical protein FJ414_17570 [Mesorhizobium sp. B3-1-6]
MFKIQKNVPIPETSRAKYPFDDLEVNDMFFVPDVEQESTQESLNALRKKVSGAASMAGKRLQKGIHYCSLGG